MDLISLGLRYLNLIVTMVKEAQVRWHKCVCIYIYIYIYIWALALLSLKKKKS